MHENSNAVHGFSIIADGFGLPLGIRIFFLEELLEWTRFNDEDDGYDCGVEVEFGFLLFRLCFYLLCLGLWPAEWVCNGSPTTCESEPNHVWSLKRWNRGEEMLKIPNEKLMI